MVGRVMIRTQRVIIEGMKPAWYVCAPRERLRLDLMKIKAEQRQDRVKKLVAAMVEAEANKPLPPKPSHMMHPEGTRRTELDMLCFVATFVALLLAPMGVAFDVQDTWAEWFLLASLACDALFALDVYSRFYSAFSFLDSHGEWRVEDRRQLCHAHYTDAWRITEWMDAALARLHARGLLFLPPNRKAPALRRLLPAPPKTAGGGRGRGVTRPAAGGFWLDLLTCFPAEVFLAMVRLPADPFYRAKARARIGGVRTFLRVVQGAKVLRLPRLRAFLNTLQRSRSTRLRGGIVIKIVLYSVLWVHWVACLWFAALRAAASTAGSSAPRRACSRSTTPATRARSPRPGPASSRRGSASKCCTRRTSRPAA